MEKRETSTIIEVLGKKYKIEKYTAWVGAFIIFKLINKALPSLFAAGDAEALQVLQNQMSKAEFTEFLKDVLSVVSVKKEAGFFPIIDEMGNLQIELQNDTITILLLAIHAIRFNASDFFLENVQNSLKEGLQGFSFFPTQA